MIAIDGEPERVISKINATLISSQLIQVLIDNIPEEEVNILISLKSFL